MNFPLTRAEWSRWIDQGLRPLFWLRDDDAVAPTPALDRLSQICEDHLAPALMAVIPAGAQPELAGAVAAHPLLHPCQHGFAHVNHAPSSEKRQEFGAHRPVEDMLAQLAQGRARLRALFGPALRPAFVPPWNRIDSRFAARLPELGLSRLSTFGPAIWPSGAPLRMDCQLDVIDWRGGRVGHSLAAFDALCAQAMTAARAAGGPPIGVLTHHLAHDSQAWRLVLAFFAMTCSLNANAWISFDDGAGAQGHD